MPKYCQVCDSQLGLLGRQQISGGLICTDCLNKTYYMSNIGHRTAGEIKARLEYLERNADFFSTFEKTYSAGKDLHVDEKNKLFRLADSPECFHFNELAEFELIEDENTVIKGGGLGRAAVGGLLFGGVGAIVGAATAGKKVQSVVRDMHIRLTLNNPWVFQYKIKLLTGETKKGSWTYNMIKQVADKLVEALDSITRQQDQQAPQAATGAADEILKYKQLLDAGVITQGEFAEKKRQLLGI